MVLLSTRWVEVKAYDKSLVHQGVLIGRNSDAKSATFTSEHNGIGTGNITLPTDHSMCPLLMEPGMRLQFRYLDSSSGVVLQMSGPVKACSVELSARTSAATFTCISDEAILRDSLAWPVPGNVLASQTSEYDVRTGAVDAVCYDLALANTSRLGRNVTGVPFFPDGPSVKLSARMQPVLDVIEPALEAANRGIRLFQWNPNDPVPFFLTGSLVNPTVLLEMYTCSDKPWLNWTPQLGVTSGSAATTAPGNTRVVVGGQGEGTSRVFEGWTESTREAQAGSLGIVERFVDARDAADAATRAQRGTEELSESAGTVALDVSTVDGDPWTLGHHYNLGDIVRVTPIEGVTRAEKVRAVTITIDGENGIRVQPKIGDPSPVLNPTNAVVRTLERTRVRTRRLESRR